jgi:Ca2+-binding EF-hand superfamily protein
LTSLRSDITGSFPFFDVEGKGTISVDNLRTVALAIGDFMDEGEALDMITGADRDGDGKVNFSEFRKVIQRTTIVPPPRQKQKYF